MSETANLTSNNTENSSSEIGGEHTGQLEPTTDFVDYVKEYAREKPEVAALWCLGVGFVLGWKLKPW